MPYHTRPGGLARFQFQQGSIITYENKVLDYAVYEFQFQQGSIITLFATYIGRIVARFNSNKVQL